MERYTETTSKEEWTLTFLRARGHIGLESAIGPDGIKLTNPAKFPEHVREFCLLVPRTDQCEGITTFDEIEEGDDLKCISKTVARRVYNARIGYTKREQNPVFKGIKFDEYDQAIGRDKKPLTDPYGHLTWCIGSEDDFHCFDAVWVAPGLIALHSVINSETGSFIMTGIYDIVYDAEAPAVAQHLVDHAFEWAYDNNVKFNRRKAEQIGRKFVKHVKEITINR